MKYFWLLNGWKPPNWANSWGILPHTFTLQIHQIVVQQIFFAFICQFIHSMTHTKYQKYIFGLRSSHLKIGVNGAGAYSIPRSLSKGLKCYSKPAKYQKVKKKGKQVNWTYRDLKTNVLSLKVNFKFFYFFRVDVNFFDLFRASI